MKQILFLAFWIFLFVLLTVLVAKVARADGPNGVWLSDPNGLMQWFEWIAADPNRQVILDSWPPLSGELHLGFKLWLRPRPTQDTVTLFVFRPDDVQYGWYSWTSADIIRENYYSTHIEAGWLEWRTVPAEAWWNLAWIALLNKTGNWSKQ